MDLENIQKLHEDFCKERDWGQFHNPKNLVMALSGEVGELTELFQWLDSEAAETVMEDSNNRQAVEEELADIMLYLSRLCFRLDVDIEKACIDKMSKNAQKYPIDKSRGHALKYSQFKK